MARCARSDCRRWRPDLVIRHARSGLRFEDRWYCSSECLTNVTSERLSEVPPVRSRTVERRQLRLGAILVHQGTLTPAELRRALDSQGRSGLPLGAELQRLGLATSPDVLRGLAAQAGIGFIADLDPVRVRRGAGNLSRDAVRALGLVPFDVDLAGERLTVACTAPVPRMAMVALRELTGWTIEPFLVADDCKARLIGAYGADRDETPARVPSSVLRNIDAAAATVARAAASDRVIRMAHVRCDPYVWVHLEGEAHTEDLRLPIETEEGHACLVAPISH